MPQNTQSTSGVKVVIEQVYDVRYTNCIMSKYSYKPGIGFGPTANTCQKVCLFF